MKRNKKLSEELERVERVEDVLDGSINDENTKLRIDLANSIEREVKLLDENKEFYEALEKVKADNVENEDYEGDGNNSRLLLLEEISDLKIALNKAANEELDLTDDIKKLQEDKHNLVVAMSEIENVLEGREKEIKTLKSELDGLKRKLGPTDYKFLSSTSVQNIIEQMDEVTRDAYESFLEDNFNEIEKVKFILALSNSLIPAAKHVLYKHLLNSDTSTQRECVSLVLSKICEEDKQSKLLVKQVSSMEQVGGITPNRKADEVTPRKPIKTILKLATTPDPSMVGLDAKPYVTKDNEGCKIIKVGDVCFIATTRSPHVITTHKQLVDAFGKPVINVKKCPLFPCRNDFIVEVTKIAPVTIVGPPNVGNIGGVIWVCYEHWALSIERVCDEDDICDLAALDHEAVQFEEKGKLKICKLSLKKRNVQKKLFSGSKKLTTRASTKKCEINSEAFIDDSDDDEELGSKK